jgi:hypothetical protein
VTKRPAAAIAFLALALLAGCGTGEGGPVSAPSFDAVLPAGWTEGDDDDLNDATDAAIQGAASSLDVSEDQLHLVAEAVWYDSESGGDFTTNINVLAEEIPPGVDEDQYVEVSLGTVQQVPGIEDFEELGSTEVGGEEAQAIEYSGSPTGIELRFRAVALVHNGQGFNITVTAPGDAFEAASDDLDAILESWEWTD